MIVRSFGDVAFILLTAVFLSGSLCPEIAHAKRSSRAKSSRVDREQTRFRAELRTGAHYDSNPIRYSNAQEQAFLNNDPASQFGISSIDDAIHRGHAGLTLWRPLVGRSRTRVDLKYGWKRYANNPVKDNNFFTMSIRQPLRRRIWVDLWYLRVPSNYIRHLWDVDFPAPYESALLFRPAVLSKTGFKAGVGMKFLRKWSVSGSLKRVRNNYNSDFDERDATVWTEELTLTRGHYAGPSLSFSSYLRQRGAEGTDPAHPEIPDSLRADVSADEWGIALSGRTAERAARWLPVQFEARVSWSARRFTTHRVDDLQHYQRKDRAVGAHVGIVWRASEAVSVFGRTRYGAQWTGGVADTDALEEAASWRQFTAGGGVQTRWHGRLPW